MVSEERLSSFSRNGEQKQKCSHIFTASASTLIPSATSGPLLCKLRSASSLSETVHSSRAPKYLCSSSAIVIKRRQSAVFIFADDGATPVKAAATSMDSILQNRETKNLRRWRWQFQIPYSDPSSVTEPETTLGLYGSFESCLSDDEHIYFKNQNPLCILIFCK